jgi:hypothetical protein
LRLGTHLRIATCGAQAKPVPAVRPPTHQRSLCATPTPRRVRQQVCHLVSRRVCSGAASRPAAWHRAAAPQPRLSRPSAPPCLHTSTAPAPTKPCPYPCPHLPVATALGAPPLASPAPVATSVCRQAARSAWTALPLSTVPAVSAGSRAAAGARWAHARPGRLAVVRLGLPRMQSRHATCECMPAALGLASATARQTMFSRALTHCSEVRPPMHHLVSSRR